MKLNPEQHGKRREGAGAGRRSSFARARSQLSQAVGDVLSGLESKRQGSWLTAFATPAASSTPHAERLREVVIRDRALFAAHPRPRRTLRDEEQEVEVASAPVEVSVEARATVPATPPADVEATASAEPALASPAPAPAPAPAAPAPRVFDDAAVVALAAALDHAARSERMPDEPAAARPAPAPAAPEETVVADAVAAAPVLATPLEDLAAKATRVAAPKAAPRAPRKPKREPIRTRTMARLLASQGHRSRALSIYEELIATDASDATLRAEADALRSQPD